MGATLHPYLSCQHPGASTQVKFDFRCRPSIGDDRKLELPA